MATARNKQKYTTENIYQSFAETVSQTEAEICLLRSSVCG